MIAPERGRKAPRWIYALLGVVGVSGLYVCTGVGPCLSLPPPDEEKALGLIEWRRSDIRCVSAEECSRAAVEAFDQATAALATGDNVRAWRQASLAEALLETGSAKSPPELADLDSVRAKAESICSGQFRELRIRFRHAEQRRDAVKMRRTLHRIEKMFPDERFQYHHWARGKMKRMKEMGTWPAGPLEAPDMGDSGNLRQELLEKHRNRLPDDLLQRLDREV